MNYTSFQDARETIKQSEEINTPLVNALRFVVQNVFANITNTLVLTLSCHKGPLEYWFRDLIGKLFVTWSFMTVQLVVVDHKVKILQVPPRRYCNFIMIDSFESLEKAHITEYNRNSDGLEYYFIFLQTPDPMTEKEMLKIFKYCFDNYWIHCSVMVQNYKGEISIFTYYPFKELKCMQTEPELINQFRGNSFVNDIIFPDKLNNFQKCRLKLSTYEIQPFVINATNKKFANISVAGFEIVTMIAISRFMNFTLDIDWIPKEILNHENDSNIFDPLKKLRNFETNVTMGYLRRSSKSDKIAMPTYVTYYIPIIAIVMRKEAEQISIGILTFPFDNTSWILTIIFYGLMVIIDYLGNICDTFKIGSFKIFKAFIGLPLMKVPKRTSKRIHLANLLISSFILRSVYQSLLFYLFRTNFYENTPLNLNGLVAAGYKAVSTEMSKEYLLNVPEIENKSLPLVTTNTSDGLYPLRYLDRYRNESFVVMTIVEFAMRFVREEMPRGDALELLPVSVKEQHIVYYLAKHSYLKERFDYCILHFHEAGLLNLWRDWTNWEYHVVTTPSTTAYEEALIVSLKQLDGFFILISILFMISMIIFGLEIVSQKYKWMQKYF